MSEMILVGRQDHIIEADAAEWRRHVAHSQHQPSTPIEGTRSSSGQKNMRGHSEGRSMWMGCI
jgi:hypothetical protein